MLVPPTPNNELENGLVAAVTDHVVPEPQPRRLHRVGAVEPVPKLKGGAVSSL